MSEARKLFEEWLDRSYPGSYSFARNMQHPVEYANNSVQLAWEAFQAGRVYEKERVISL